MLSGRQRPLPRVQVSRAAAEPDLAAATDVLRPMRGNQRTRHGHQLRLVDGMAEEDDAVAILGVRAALLREREDDAVHGRLEEAVGPEAEEVADVDQDRGERLLCRPVPLLFFSITAGCCFSRLHRHRSPGPLRGEDLETRLARPLEEERDAAVVRVRAGPDIDVVPVAGRRGGGEGGVVEEAEDAARGALGGIVSGGEEVGGDLVGVSVEIFFFLLVFWFTSYNQSGCFWGVLLLLLGV
ncbi:hypothetical protein VTN02DRAFT_4572 [Thermoascus thermophilus]